MHNRVGYVPHTILSVVATREDSPQSVPPQDPLFVAPGVSQNSGPPSANYSQVRSASIFLFQLYFDVAIYRVDTVLIEPRHPNKERGSATVVQSDRFRIAASA